MKQETKTTMLASVLRGVKASRASRSNPVVKRLLTPEEISVVSAAGGGSCGGDGYTQSGGKFTQKGGEYTQDSGDYTMDCSDDEAEQ